MMNMKLLSMAGTLAGLSVLAGASSETKDGPRGWLASDLIGMNVSSQQGDSLGKIEDVVVHPGGEASYAILSFGGTLGMGDKLFAMPWSALRAIEPDTAKKDSTRSLVLPLDKEHLKTAPGFDRKSWPITANADWSKDIDAFYAAGHNSNTRRPVEASTRTSARTSGVAWRVTELDGANVETPTGEKLGDIEEVAVDTHGRVCFVVVSVGGFLGMGEKHVAVPWESLKFSDAGDKTGNGDIGDKGRNGDKRDDASNADKVDNGDKRVISLASTKKQLEEAPEFEQGKETNNEMCDPKWIGRVYEHYSVPAYWNDMNDVDTRAKPKN